MAGEKERYMCATGPFQGESFNRVFAGHRFSDRECRLLERGQSVLVEDARRRNGGTFACRGKLERKTYNGREFVGFSIDSFPVSWCEHMFTDDERAMLEMGKEIFIDGFISRKGNVFGCFVRYGEDEDGKKKIIPNFDRHE